MAIKESSDELNPAVLTSQSVLTLPQPARSLKDYLALIIATCGVGYLPLAPGTWGSLVGVGLHTILRGVLVAILSPAIGRNSFNIAYSVVALELVGIVCIALIGIWAGSRTEKLFGKKDPGKVVIDEVAGQMLALTAIPLAGPIWTAVLAFGAFRFFDIVKPYPARRLESLESGLGIMADDIIAGAYAALTVAVVVLGLWLV
jgi:phosphatidylglycerophosphatase A